MRSKILEMEKVSRLLEPAAGEREAIRKNVIDYSEHFLNHIENFKAYESEGDAHQLLSSPIGEEPIDIAKIISLLKENVDRPGLNPASGGHLGYIPGGGIYYSALGDYMADVFNRYAGIFFAAPGAVRMENQLIRWLTGVAGFPESAAGNLTSGGSIANLMAVVCARNASGIHSRDYERAVIYMTQQVHHSVDKAIRIAGLNDTIVRHVPMNNSYRMDATALDQLIQKDRKDGLLPFLVIASAGTTDVGAVDPLSEIESIVHHHQLWYHVDAAYGGFFILTEEGEKKLKGMGSADSLVMDPHKGLFLPYGTGALLVRDKKFLNASHYYQANYMQDAQLNEEEPSPADLSPELTKHFRGLRLWLPLQLLGVKPFRACLEEKLLLAKYFYEEVQKIGFETGPEPDLSVVTYRFIPEKGDANEFNKQLLHEIQKDGRVFISSTMLDACLPDRQGKFTLRAAILAFRTHLSTIDTLLEMLKYYSGKIGEKF